MKALAIWLRRGVGRWLALGLFCFVLTSLLTQTGWTVELDWATRLTCASLILACPCVAAAAAFDVSVRLRPTMTALSQGSPRTSTHLLLPAIAVVAWAGAAYLGVWAVAAVMVAQNGGVGVTDWWVFAEVLAPVTGAGMVGLLVGMAVAGRWAAPLAAVVTFACTAALSPWGRGPFEAVTTFGTLTGLERPGLRVASVIVGVLVIAAAAAVAASDLHRPRGTRRAVVLCCSVVALAGACLPAMWPWQQDIYVVTHERFSCVGDAPKVCAPTSRLHLVEPVQTSLAQAYRTLKGTEFTRPSTFRITRLDHYSDLNGAAPLDFDPADVRHGSYPTGEVARALVRPHQCSELFNASKAMPLLEAQDVVMPWLEAALDGDLPPWPVPVEVATAFQKITSCTPMTGDLK